MRTHSPPAPKYSVLPDSLTRIDSVVQSGDTFGRLFQDKLPTDVIQAIYRASEQDFHLRRIRVGQPYTFIMAGDQFRKWTYEIDSKGVYEILRTDTGYHQGVRLYDFQRDTVFIEGRIETSLTEAVTSHNEPALLAYEIANVFAWDIDFVYDIRQGDQFKVYYERLFRNDTPAGIGHIIAAEFRVNGRTYTAYLYQYPDSAVADYIDADFQNVKKAFLRAPVNFSRISSGFTGRRFHPILRRIRSHYGIDYVAPKNEPVFTIADGIVMAARFQKYNGNYVHVRHAGGFETKYLHFNGFARGIRRGSVVKQGQVIGYIGKTGLATGYHVCFRLYRHGQPIDIHTIENPKQASLPERYRASFEQYMARFPFTRPQGI